MSRFLDWNSENPADAQAFRMSCRKQEHVAPTSGFCMDFVQVNVVFLPSEYAYDFLLFCQRNPKPCPLLEATTTNSSDILAPGSNLYTDLPRYNVISSGKIISTLLDVSEYQSRNLHVFLLGCSFSFEQALIAAGIPMRHIDENKNVSMYITNLDARPAGVFSGPVIVSMRPILQEKLNLAIEISSRFPGVHGAPIHYGNPQAIGIKDINKVDYGDAVTINQGEIPVFWACGVTPMQAILNANLAFAITHCPGHMFVTDKANISLDISNITFKYE